MFKFKLPCIHQWGEEELGEDNTIFSSCLFVTCKKCGKKKEVKCLNYEEYIEYLTKNKINRIYYGVG